MTDDDQPTADQLYDKGVEAIKRPQFDRRFYVTWLLLAVLALMSSIALITSTQAQHSVAQQAKTTADAAKQQSGDTVAYLRGEEGIPGVPGANGVDGTPGLPGGSGEKGATGAVGPAGPTGPTGPTGPAGSGTAGATGVTGPTGALGPAGAMGLPGVAGPLGAAGEAGETGKAGAAGPKGATGPKGAAGPRGPQGQAGAAGATGPQGPAGPAATLSTSVAINASANDEAASKQVTVVCPAGRATGGGFAIVPSDPGLIPTATGPVGNNGWSATVEKLSLPPGTVWQVLVFAICTT